MNKYLCTNRPELAQNEIDSQEGLEESILARSTVRVDGTIDRRSGIRLKTARKWLNRLGYKWKEVQKGVFFDGHKREDVVEYKEILNEMKKLLSYLVEFSEDGSMISKKYSEDCAMDRLNRRPVIMITYDGSTFSANDGRRKV